MPSTFDNLDDWLKHLEQAHPVGIDMGLERINRVKKALDLKFEALVFTVAGTNGKGSTCALLESILIAASYKVGCHTSPHLLKFNERARIQGEIVSDELLQNISQSLSRQGLVFLMHQRSLTLSSLPWSSCIYSQKQD